MKIENYDYDPGVGASRLDVTVCVECGTRTHEVTMSGRCLLCQRMGSILSNGGRRIPPRPSAPPRSVISSDVEMASLPSSSPRVEFLKEDSWSKLDESDHRTEEDSWTEIEIGPPTASGEEGQVGGGGKGASVAGGRCKLLIAAMIVAGGVAAVVFGSLAVAGRLGETGGDAGSAAPAKETDSDQIPAANQTTAPTVPPSLSVTTPTPSPEPTDAHTEPSTAEATPSPTTPRSRSPKPTTFRPTPSATTPAPTASTVMQAPMPSTTPMPTSAATVPATNSTTLASNSTLDPSAVLQPPLTTLNQTTNSTVPASNSSITLSTLSPTTAPYTAPPTTTHPATAPPTVEPTAAPTPKLFHTEPVPANPPRGYFNYDPDDALYGPDGWQDLNAQNGLLQTQEYLYWSQFEDSIRRDLTVNQCSGGDGRQSPIDVRMDAIKGFSRDPDGRIRLPEGGTDLDQDGNFDEYEDGVCYEHHEIRTSPGRFLLQDSSVKKEIHPNKLRLVYDSQATTLVDTPLPGSDFPHQWGGRIDLKHVDVHVPSQHKIEGKEYPAEYQLWHLHPRRRKAPVVSIMVDVHPQNKMNRHFQKALVEWQKVWDAHHFACERRRRRLDGTTADRDSFRREENDVSETGSEFDAWDDEGLPEEEEEKEERLTFRRRAQANTWDPYDTTEIMRSIHFYGYSGSLLEPPCTEFVEWHVLDEPMLISQRQLHHLKHLIFRHRDENCHRTSNHYEGRAVRRPLRDIADQNVHRCTCRDFLSDERNRNLNVTRCTTQEEQAQLQESLGSN